MNSAEILKLSQEYLPYMTEIRRHLHRNPKVGFDNRETMEYIRQRLDDLSIKSEYMGRCGLCALIGHEEPCFLLRADTDGLAIREETTLSYRSENGNMHACGHDLHTAQLLGCAKILKSLEGSLCGSIKLMFQSAEESLEGARDMIEAGILENPKPCGGMMLHAALGTDFEDGTIIIPGFGETAPAADFFEVIFTGKGCHGSSPSLGKDPVYAACSAVISLSEINSRELSINQRAVLTIGSFNAGEQANVIPETAVIKGTLRCFGADTREYIRKRLCEICEKTAEVFGVKANVRYTSGCPSLLNGSRLCKASYEALSSVFGENMIIKAENIPQNDNKTSGSEDFSYISQEIPTVMLAVASGRKKDGYIYPLHNAKTEFSEKAMVYGCAALAIMGLHCTGGTNRLTD